MRTAAADLRASRGQLPITIVTLYCPAFTVRAAKEAIEVANVDADGPYLYDARLVSVSDFNPEVDLFSLERSEINSARVSLVLPEDMVPASLEMQGHHLAASRCEVARIWPGQTWAQREVYVGRGIISGLKLGRAGEPVSFVAEALPPLTGRPIGDASRDMSRSGGYPTLGYTKLEGRQYPTVIGRCYKIPAFKIGVTSGGYGLLVAGHHFATSFNLFTYEGEQAPTAYIPAGAISFVNGADADDGPVAYLESTSSADYAAAQGAFTVDCPNGAMTSAEGGSGAAVGADQVVAWILANCGEQVDFAAMRRTYALLQGLDLGVYMSSAADSLRVLRERIIKFLPLIEEEGPGGIWLRYTDIQSQPSEIDLVEGVNIVGFEGGPEQVSDPDDLRNQVTISYAYDHAVGRFTKSYTVGASGVGGHPGCALSQQLYGVRVDATIECNVCWDDRTAAFMAWSRMSRLALPRFAYTAIVDPSLYWLREGTIATLTAPTWGIEARKCVIRSVPATQDPPRIVIEPVPIAGLES